ncbi:hypothetical protein BpHYR1_029379 [Brachionus plicatilis]|uniref:Uncharacterized protein n=1 Tax=Brachionus plicatilis TaxID=10195 RepID=A0A3M7PAE3_BRAPC|nr:hypothetical protein BpHYR1_029379 [Brachionus plicatilis]
MLKLDGVCCLYQGFFQLMRLQYRTSPKWQNLSELSWEQFFKAEQFGSDKTLITFQIIILA